MAGSSPAPSNNSNDTTTTSTTTATATATAATIATTGTTPNGTATASATTSQRSDAPKNLRGLNKPKCSQCGNVARSRRGESCRLFNWHATVRDHLIAKKIRESERHWCPYQSCKSCCAKAQNPCHIHVLKANATFPDKAPSLSSPMFDQQSTDVSPSGASLRLSSLRQLSNNFAQFNAAQVSNRGRRPLTRKDAANINQWRFSKLKEYKDRNIEVENEAFDRYMQNVSLLEEAFLINSSLEGPMQDHTLTAIKEENSRKLISGLKAKLRSNQERTVRFKERLRDLIDRGLGKLQEFEFSDDLGTANTDDLDGLKELKKRKNAKNWQAEKVSAVNDLLNKLNKARNEEELQSCLAIKSQLFNRHGNANLTESKDVEISKERTAKDVSVAMQESNYSLPKLWSTVAINQESLDHIDMHFSSLEQIEDL